MAQLNLVVPGLCGPLPEVDRLSRESVSSMVAWLAKAERRTITPQNYYEVLAMLFALDGAKPLPVAALSLLADGRDTEQGHWFCFDPVHLQADMDHAILRTTHGLDFSQQEAEALLAELNAHFQQDNIHFLLTDKHNWLLHSTGHARVKTTPVHDVVGRNVYAFMPQGEDALFWKKLMNEVQMLLHQSPVNQQREAEGKLAVNGAWLWGEGRLPDIGGAPQLQVFARQALLRGLAALTGNQCQPLSDANAFLEQITGHENSLLVLDDLFDVTSYGDVMAWQAALDELYTHWLQPIFQQALRKKIQINLYPCNGVCYQFTGRRWFSLFHDKRISSYIDSYA